MEDETETIITREYLKNHPNEIFVFGDNTKRVGKGGAAILRDCKNTYGFVTKKLPTHDKTSHYTIGEYFPVFDAEVIKLKAEISRHPERTYLISKLGAGLANYYHIFEEIISPRIKNELKEFKNVRFLW